MAINDYCTVAEIKQALPAPSGTSWPSTWDTELTRLATVGSRSIDRATGRQPGAFYVNADVTRYFEGSGTTELCIGELAAAPTTVSVAESGVIDNAANSGGSYTAWTSDDYILWPYTSDTGYEPYTKLVIAYETGTSKSIWYPGPRMVKIVGPFGWSITTPADIKEAAIIAACRDWKRGQQGFQDTAALAELGQLIYTKGRDPRYQDLIMPYMRVRL